LRDRTWKSCGDDLIACWPQSRAELYDSLVVATGGKPSVGKHFFSPTHGIFTEEIFRVDRERRLAFSRTSPKLDEFPNLPGTIGKKPLSCRTVSVITSGLWLNLVPLRSLATGDQPSHGGDPAVPVLMKLGEACEALTHLGKDKTIAKVVHCLNPGVEV